MEALDIGIFECQVVFLEDLFDDVQPQPVPFALPCALFAGKGLRIVGDRAAERFAPVFDGDHPLCQP